MKPLKIISLGVIGLRESKKRANTFKWLRISRILFCCRKPTFTVIETLTLSQRSEGGGGHFWSFSTCQSRGGGGGILFSESFQGKIYQNSTRTDHEGRSLSVTVEINDTTVQVCNVYCPNDATELSEFLDSLPSYIKGGTSPPITGGDWNCVENPQMDKFGGNPHMGAASLASLRFFSQAYGLVDVFRKHNPTTRSFM